VPHASLLRVDESGVTVPVRSVQDAIVIDVADPPSQPCRRIATTRADRRGYEGGLGFAARLIFWAMRNC